MTTEFDRWASEIRSALDFLGEILCAKGFIHSFKAAKDRIETALAYLESSVPEPAVPEPLFPVLEEAHVLLDVDGNIYANIKGVSMWIGQINKCLPQSEATPKFLLWVAARALVNQREEEIFRDHEKNHTRLT